MDDHGGKEASDRGFSSLFQSASSLLSSSFPSSSSSSSPPSSDDHGHHTPGTSTQGSHGRKPSYGDLMSSSQVLLQAARAKLHKGGGGSEEAEVDMAEVAGAAGDLLEAVAHCAKLDEGKYGRYVHKAEEYLHEYELKHGRHAATPLSHPQGVSGAAAPASASPQGYPTNLGRSEHAPPDGYGFPPGDTSSYPAPPPGYPSHGSSNFL